MNTRCSRALAAVLLAALATTGCGLKGALTLPSKSDEVIIRTPGQTAPATDGTTAVPPTATPPSAIPPATSNAPANPTAPTGPTAEGAVRKPARDERIPPPPLPGGNPGTARGG